MEPDPRIYDFFNGKIQQVFFYITNRCQLSCKQCLYKTQIDNDSSDVDFNVAYNLLEIFRKMGAFKISFLGGEPTLYQNNGKNFGDLIVASKDLGYTYIRTDTNGQFSQSFLEDKNFKFLDEITFSLDGYNEELNDCVRGKNSFITCVNSIKKAIALDFNVQVTTCVHSNLCNNVSSGINNLKKMILFCESLGVRTINFHPIIKVGIPRDQWINETDISPDTWVDVYDGIHEWVNQNTKIHVRIPTRFIAQKKYKQNPSEFDYCPLKLRERILIFPNGELKICAFNIGTPKGIGRFTNDALQYLDDENNEEYLTCSDSLLCVNQKIDKNPNLVPLCMSYKPHQIEPVWNNLFRYQEK